MNLSLPVSRRTVGIGCGWFFFQPADPSFSMDFPSPAPAGRADATTPLRVGRGNLMVDPEMMRCETVVDFRWEPFVPTVPAHEREPRLEFLSRRLLLSYLPRGLDDGRKGAEEILNGSALLQVSWRQKLRARGRGVVGHRKLCSGQERDPAVVLRQDYS